MATTEPLKMHFDPLSLNWPSHAIAISDGSGQLIEFSSRSPAGQNAITVKHGSDYFLIEYQLLQKVAEFFRNEPYRKPCPSTTSTP